MKTRGVIKIYVIFTDLDGTLLDENYSYSEALPVLNILKEKNVPVIFCSAKTRTEQEVIREEMGINHPFIAEDGSAIYIPAGYFGRRVGEVVDGYEVVVLGVRFEEIQKEIEKLRKRYRIKGYYNMSDEEVAKVTGLSLEDAKRAKQREFSETIVEADEEALEELKKKFNVVIGGRFIHIFGKGADKGKAVRILTDMYREISREVTTIGIGNSYNDEPMLRAVDIPAIVKNPEGWADLKIENIYKAEGVGPQGWAEVVRKFVLAKE